MKIKLIGIGFLIGLCIGTSILYSKTNKETIPNLPELMNLRMDTCPYPNDKMNKVASLEDTEFGYRHCSNCNTGVLLEREDKTISCTYCGKSPNQSN